MAHPAANASPALWGEVIGMIRERFPLLRAAGVQDRVYRVESLGPTGPGGVARELTFITYTGRRLTFRDVTGFDFQVERTDRQGVPLVYQLTLRTADGGTHALQFYA